MDDQARLVRFYDEAYTQHNPAEVARNARWRALGAVGKADHVLALCARAGLWAGGSPSIPWRSAAATVPCCASCTSAALAGVCQASRSLRRPWTSRASGCRSTGPSSTTARTCRPATARMSWASSRTCWSTCPTRRRCWPRRRARAGRWRWRCRWRPTCPRGAPPSASTPMRSATCSGSTAPRRGRSSRGRAFGSRASWRTRCRSPSICSSQPARPRRARAGAKRALRTCLHRLAPGLARRLFTVHYACLCLPRA